MRKRVEHIRLIDEGVELPVETEEEIADSGLFESRKQTLLIDGRPSSVPVRADLLEFCQDAHTIENEYELFEFIRKTCPQFDAVSNAVYAARGSASESSKDWDDRKGGDFDLCLQDSADTWFLNKMARETLENGGEVYRAAAYFIGMGMALQRLKVRHLERVAKNGKAQARRNKEISAANKADGDQRRKARTEQVAAEIARQVTEGVPANYGLACQRVADAEGVSSEIVKKSVPNTWTRGRRGRKSRSK